MLFITPSVFYFLVSSTLLSLITISDGKPTSRKCGTLANRKGRVVGGNDAFEGEFKWMVSLKSHIGHFCSAFVISDRHLVSAAHCFIEKYNKFLEYSDSGGVILNSLNITLGEFSLKSREKVDALTVPVEKLIIHPDFHPLTKENDIAIIQLNHKGISAHPNVEPICLPGIEYRSDVGKKVKNAVAVGWGRTRYNQSYWEWVLRTDVLQKVIVPLWSSKNCAEQYTMYHFPSKAFICAGERDRGSCVGDSGGPLQILGEDNKWIAVGVVSAGRKCGEEGKPGIYMNIASVLKWIHDHIS